MKNVLTTERWEDISWDDVHRYVFRLQKKIFDAENSGNTKTVRKLQNKLAGSFHAKLLAVRQVAQVSRGRRTAGIDGIRSPTNAAKLRMANELSVDHRPSTVLRKQIPKPGSDELRPLGIPNLIDRAHQALLVIILEPQWETHFSRHQYGFRKGRGPKDAVEFIRRHLRCTGPEWAASIDIEKFFDRLDHQELLRLINAPEAVLSAVARTLQAGGCATSTILPGGIGTPQGGPLSPLLANIALAGLEEHLEGAFLRDYKGKITATKRPTLAIYADDAVLLHRDRQVVEWALVVIRVYLKSLGLKLNEGKTEITHTKPPLPREHKAGFDFLGFHIQHVLSRAPKPGKNRLPYVLVTPSKTSMKRFYRKCAERIDREKLSRKQRGARRHSQAKGKRDPVTIMIYDLNRMIRGWTNYFRSCNAKAAFSHLDHLLHTKLWQWAKRRFNKKTVQWIIDHLFSAVETDHKDEPLLRQDGTPRERSWAFHSPFVSREPESITLLKLADVPVGTHSLVDSSKSYFDGDWSYWQPRRSTPYPGSPPMLPLTAYRRQRGKCIVCSQPILKGQRFAMSKRELLDTIHHQNCQPQ